MKSHRPGVDVAGQIVAVGERVTQFEPGEAAFGVCKGASPNSRVLPKTS